jgi:hypothetical protein
MQMLKYIPATKLHNQRLCVRAAIKRYYIMPTNEQMRIPLYKFDYRTLAFCAHANATAVNHHDQFIIIMSLHLRTFVPC